MRFGYYRVTGPRDYRGHTTGEEFIARLDRNAEYRAVTRGDIICLKEVRPTLPSVFAFPQGWLTAEPSNTR